MTKIPHLPVDWTPFLEKAQGSFALSIVIIYNDMHSALRAAQMVESLGGKFGGKMQPSLQPLPLAQLSDPGQYDRSLSDAASADMVIVSINGPDGLPSKLKQWVQDYTAQKREGDSAVVALLGTMNEADEADSPRLQFLLKSARAAGLDFFSPRVPEEGAEAVFNTLEVAG